MSTNKDTPYSPGAYRGDSNEPLPRPKWRGHLNRGGQSSTHLAFGNYAELDSATEITLQLECEKHRLQKQKKNAKKQEVYCDAKRWRFQKSRTVINLLSFFKTMSIVFSLINWGMGAVYFSLEELGFIEYPTETAYLIATILTPLMIVSAAAHMDGKKITHYIQISVFIISSSLVIWATGNIWGDSLIHFSLWLGTVLYFMGAIGLDFLIWLYDTFSRHDGSEFNRAEGMVRFKPLFQSLFVAPFEEFDPVLTLLPWNYGIRGYTIMLHHRYTNNKVCLADKMHSLGLDKANTLAFWDSLQRYMDVTQPLPDLPVLEQSRHLDPVTSAHDARIKRNPRRWRDQALTGWKTSGEKKLNEQLQHYPWQQQPCVIKSRLSEELTIEAWYRAQEAKGIQATPKAEDFTAPIDFENG